MRSLIRPLFIALLATLSTATTSKPAMRVHEHRASPPGGFVALDKADAQASLTLRLALKSRDREGLIKALYRVSDPHSLDYGKHLSKAEVEAFIAPTAETQSAVKEWLSDQGIAATPISSTGDSIEFTIPVFKANAIFHADFTVFRHKESGTEGTRTLKYSIPAALQAHIAFLSPGISFWAPQSPIITQSEGDTLTGMSHAEKRQGSADCTTSVTPACLQSRYGIPSAPATQPSTVGVLGISNQYSNKADLRANLSNQIPTLQKFLVQQRPDIPANTTFSEQFVNGGVNPQNPFAASVFANTVTQYTMGTARSLVTFISVGSNGELQAMEDAVDYLLAQTDPPKVVVIPYASSEDAIGYLRAYFLCVNRFSAAAARGITIVVSSGDGGVAGSQADSECTKFRSTFPASCPYVTSVGATTLNAAGVETAAPFSSGGYSNIFALERFELDAFISYRNQTPGLNQGYFNTSGAITPDVSLVGDRYSVVWAGQNLQISSTAGPAAVFGAVVALLNDLRAAAGKSAMGFLGPFLYQNGQAFNDVVAGSNPGCGTNGWPAKTGWDPATGLGTPNFTKLAAAAVAAP